MSKENSKKVNGVKIAVGYLSHMLVTLVMFAGIAYFVNEIILEKAWNETYFRYAGILFLIIALYSLIDCKRLYSYFRTEIILIFCFMVSALLLLLSDYYVNVPIWLIGGIAAAALVNRNIGMLYVYFFVFHAIYLQGDTPNGLLFHFVCATLVCILIPKMKTWAAMFYMMIFSGALVIALSIVINHFVIDKAILLDAFAIMCVYFVCIFITMLFVLLLKTNRKELTEEPEEEISSNYDYLERMAEETENAVPVQSFEVPVQMQVQKEEASFVMPEFTATITKHEDDGIIVMEDFSEYCNEKAGLLTELKQKKKAVYAHAVLAGKLAYNAAEKAGLNATLAKAAALYESIGQLHSEESEAVAAVLTENHFPESLVQVICSLNNEQIDTKEAAVVAMADDIISNYTVIRHIKKMSLPADKIVDKTLAKKMFAGEYNFSGLTLAEYSALRDAFVEFLQEQDKKHA